VDVGTNTNWLQTNITNRLLLYFDRLGQGWANFLDGGPH